MRVIRRGGGGGGSCKSIAELGRGRFEIFPYPGFKLTCPLAEWFTVRCIDGHRDGIAFDAPLLVLVWGMLRPSHPPKIWGEVRSSLHPPPLFPHLSLHDLKMSCVYAYVLVQA